MKITNIMLIVVIGVILLTILSKYIQKKHPGIEKLIADCFFYGVIGAIAVLAGYGIFCLTKCILEHAVMFLSILVLLLTAAVFFVMTFCSPYHEMRKLVRKKVRKLKKNMRKIARENQKFDIDHCHSVEKNYRKILDYYNKMMQLIPSYYLADNTNKSFLNIINRIDDAQEKNLKLWMALLKMHSCGIQDVPTEVQNQIEALYDALNALYGETATGKENGHQHVLNPAAAG